MSLPTSAKGERQIPIMLPHEERRDKTSFVLSQSNSAAFELINRWPAWPIHRACLTGPAGSGKSHLVQIWCGLSQAECIDAKMVAGRLTEFWEAEAPLAIDNAEAFVDQPDDLFHLINKAHYHNIPLLIASGLPIVSLGQNGPQDLVSRLRASAGAELGEADEELIFKVFCKLFSDRQLRVDDSVIHYLIPRIERSLDAVRQFVEVLDREALIERRSITRAFAASVLARQVPDRHDI